MARRERVVDVRGIARLVYVDLFGIAIVSIEFCTTICLVCILRPALFCYVATGRDHDS